MVPTNKGDATVKIKGIVSGLLAWERTDAAVKARSEGRPLCTCGWPCDDPELDLCIDCFDAITMRQILRGDFGPQEQAEAQESTKEVTPS